MSNKKVSKFVLLLFVVLVSNSAHAWTMQGDIEFKLLNLGIQAHTTAWQEDTEDFYGFGVNVIIEKEGNVVRWKVLPNCPVLVFGIRLACRVKADIILPSIGDEFCGSGKAQIYNGATLTGPIKNWGDKCITNSLFDFGDEDEEECAAGPNPDTPEVGEDGEEVECDDSPPSSPILLDLDRNQFHLSGGPVTFDVDADGQPESITWVAPGTQDAFLFLDRNGNGIADDGSELFGNATMLFSGEQAEQGYEALAEFDLVENGGNQDGVISDADSIFSDLGVWIDSHANGIHESFESQGLAEAGVLSIGLDYRESRRTDSHGNEFRYIGSGSIEVNGKSEKMATTDVFFKILAE